MNMKVLTGKNIVCLLFGVTLLFLLAQSLYSYNYKFSLTHYEVYHDLFSRMFGEARQLLSSYSVMQVDKYIHGGVRKEDYDSYGRRKGYSGSHGKMKIPPWNGLLSLAGQIRVAEHVHRLGREVKELIPWYHLAVRLNPHNTHAYVMGGYFLAQQMHLPDRAIEFLKEGLGKNPYSWEIYEELGSVYLIEKKEYRYARYYYQQAAHYAANVSIKPVDKKRILYFTGYCYELEGRIDQAIQFYKKALEVIPSDNNLLQRIQDLENLGS